MAVIFCVTLQRYAILRDMQSRCPYPFPKLSKNFFRFLLPGEDLLFKVAAEVVEEAELVVGAHQAVDDVRQVPALRDMSAGLCP